MTTHIMSFTYAPKIDAVLSGECRQTIRKKREGRKIKHGDFILFHGWEGRPYRSKWSWRKKVRVTEVAPLWIHENYVRGTLLRYVWDSETMNVQWIFRLPRTAQYVWDSETMNHVAVEDGIDPPTGEALKETLKKLNGPDWEGEYEIIRWEPVEGSE